MRDCLLRAPKKYLFWRYLELPNAVIQGFAPRAASACSNSPTSLNAARSSKRGSGSRRSRNSG